MTTPYTYILKFIPTNQLYYGVRYKEGCHPNELFITYFSSSKVIKRLIKDYGIDSFEYEIRKTYLCKKSARDWEQKFLIKVDAAHNPKFLNQSNNMKGILRSPGDYSWHYNPLSFEKLLLKNSEPPPLGFIKGVRGPDLKQKGTVIITNISTGKQLKLSPTERIPDGFVRGRTKGTTTDTKWICNDVTHNTKLIHKNESIPEGWRLGNLNIKNKNKVKIHILEPYLCKSVDQEEVAYYLARGWKLGNPKSIIVKIFKLSAAGIEQKVILTSEFYLHEIDGWYRGTPVMYKIYFTNGEILTYPYQWFTRNMGISVDMIRYAYLTGGKSIKYKFDKVEKLT